MSVATRNPFREFRLWRAIPKTQIKWTNEQKNLRKKEKKRKKAKLKKRKREKRGKKQQKKERKNRNEKKLLWPPGKE